MTTTDRSPLRANARRTRMRPGGHREVPALLLALLLFDTLAHGATFTVDSVVDAVDANPGNGVCADTGGNCTLRAAIQEANALPGAHTISVPAGTYTLTVPGPSYDLDINGELIITGAGADSTIVEACSGAPCTANDRVFEVAPGAVATISGVTIQNGSATVYGGGISNQGTLTLNASTVRDSSTVNLRGGGIYNSGTMTVTDSTVSGNLATWSFGNAYGGGVYNESTGTLSMSNSTVSDNTVVATYGEGGGIANWGILRLTNCTVSGNTTAYGGGGIYNNHGATVTVNNSTVYGNAAYGVGLGVGGGICNSCHCATVCGIGTAILKNTILAENSAYNFGPNYAGSSPITSAGYNLCTDGSCTGLGGTDLPNTPAHLGQLNLNSPGTTKTHSLLSASPAIDAVPLADCTDADSTPVATDQRGVARPQGGACDIGAYEGTGCIPTGAQKLRIVDKLATPAAKAEVFYQSNDGDAPITKGSGTPMYGAFDFSYVNGATAGQFVLPASGWFLFNNQNQANYLNLTAPNPTGGAWAALVRSLDKLRLQGRSLGDTPIDIMTAGPPGPLGVKTVFTVNDGSETYRHCTLFTKCKWKFKGLIAQLTCSPGTPSGD